MNKRDRLLNVLDRHAQQAEIPAGFFMHFGPGFSLGPSAVEKHLEFYRSTGMDFVKIQYERGYPRIDSIQTPSDWAKMPFYTKEFYEPQLQVVEGLVKAAKSEAVVVITLYSPLMCAGHTVGEQRLTSHILEDPDAVNKGMQIITDSLMLFVKECIRIGVDGFYTSTQGAETYRFPDRGPFLKCVKPFDLQLMEEANRHCAFNILHVCDYHGGYTDLDCHLDYPGQIINCNPVIGGQEWSATKISEKFGRPFMGGLDRKGILATGTPAEVRSEARRVINATPNPFILAADCTVPGETSWENLKAAIDEAHRGR